MATSRVKSKTSKTKNRNNGHSVSGFFKSTGIILLPLVIGMIASFFTFGAQENFGTFRQPPLAPPAWLFPVAWSILYLMMGVASYLVYRVKAKTWKERRFKVTELVIFYVQLIFNFAWTLLFFNANVKYFAFGWLIFMWLMILSFIIMAFKNCKAAAWLMIPYILWCTFAAYLNISIAILN